MNDADVVFGENGAESFVDVGVNNDVAPADVITQERTKIGGQAGAISNGLATITNPHAVAALVNEVRARVDATKNLKAAMLSMTSPLDWVGHERRGPDGRVEHVPYLQASGAIKLFHPFGLEVKIQPGRLVHYDDGTFEVVFEGAVRASALGPNWLPVVGSRWSGDPFFTRRGDVIDPGDVRKAALSNWYQNAIIAILGLENMTWDELRAAGINPDHVRRVTWEGAKKQTQDQQTAYVKPNSGKYFAIEIAFKDEKTKAELKNLGAKWGPAYGFDIKAWILPATDEIRKRLTEMQLKFSVMEVK